jgi:hypothetical protein
MVDSGSSESSELEQEQTDGGHMVRARGRKSRGRDRHHTSERLEGSFGSLPDSTFRAILASNNAIKIDSEGSAKVTLEVPASEIAEVLKLVMYQNRLMTVRISEN